MVQDTGVRSASCARHSHTFSGSAGEINEAAFSYGYDRVRFIGPVFIGDTITSKATIIAKRDHAKKPDDYGIVDEQVTVTNQRGETVIAFIHVYMVRKK